VKTAMSTRGSLNDVNPLSVEHLFAFQDGIRSMESDALKLRGVLTEQVLQKSNEIKLNGKMLQ
jgi:hypothetical protein